MWGKDCHGWNPKSDQNLFLTDFALILLWTPLLSTGEYRTLPIANCYTLLTSNVSWQPSQVPLDHLVGVY